MNKSERQALRKSLPYDFQKKIAEDLNSKGFPVGRDTVRDIWRGKNKNVKLIVRFWKSLHRLKHKHEKEMQKISSSKSL
ncbi:MAG TPA: hypothetical protein PL045_06390 [Chitinophagaceae bacterium]|nr:hypothetical protein [Chitinophagaceae bacterium]